MGAQVEYHYYPDSVISRPPVMLGVLQGLKRFCMPICASGRAGGVPPLPGQRHFAPARHAGRAAGPDRVVDRDIYQHARAGVQVEYHYYPDSAISRPPVMLGVLQGLRRRGLRAFSVEPNIWGASSGHDSMEYAYIQARLLITFPR